MTQPRTNQSLALVPRELRIERRVTDRVRSAAVSWLPIALLAPVALAFEALPAAIGVLLVTGFSLRELKRSRGNILPVLALADRGNLSEAIDQVAAMAKKERTWHRKAALIGLLSNLELRGGDPETALALAREAVRHPQKQRPMLERSLNANLAMILALTSNTELAEDFLPSEPIPDSLTDLPRLIVWARAGRWAEVADYSMEAAPSMLGFRHSARVTALMKAAALHHQKSGALLLQRYLDDARPQTTSEFAYLTQEWPELKEFIANHPQLKARRNLLERA